MSLAVLLLLSATALAPAAPRRRAIRYCDLQPAIRELFSEERFVELIRSIDKDTEERLIRGENEHLVYYLLQSSRFTTEPKIEPARSAYEFVHELGRDRIPVAVLRRIDALIEAVQRRGIDERLSYFRRFLQGRGPLRPYLETEYARVMEFLYQKEFSSKETQPSEKGTFLESLYQQRGHSSDTRIEANFAVWMALSVLKALQPSIQLTQVLIVGPGLDFAPRARFFDEVPPQSYQPFAIADALLGLRLGSAGQLRIHSVDINDRVVDFLRNSSARELPELIIRPELQPTPELRGYFQQLGRAIGTTETERGSLRLTVRKEIANKISAERMNILTERYNPSPVYDLAIVTNVFLYFNDTELALALSNISSILKPGGYLIHNEFRPRADDLSARAGFQSIQARTIRFAGGLLDGFVIARKSDSTR